MDNKVVQTLARAMVQLGYTAVRFNFRGVGGSEGSWDHGQGEVQDALAVSPRTRRDAGQPLVLGGFSFGGYVASQAAAQLPPGRQGPSGWCWWPGGRQLRDGRGAAGQPGRARRTDDVVPLAAVFDWARPQALPVTVLPGAGHFFHGQLTVLKHIVLRAWGCPERRRPAPALQPRIEP
jgi:alpha/beta superfamily hydrolase